MDELARMSAGERRRMIDDFVSDTFDGLDTETPGAHIAQNMRTLPVELPDEPAPEQVEAWIELAELVRDEAFRKRAREMALAGARADVRPSGPDPGRIQEHAGGAVRADVAPESAEGAEILSRIVDPGLPAPERLALADQLATFTDRRVERYWQLLGMLNGWPPRPPQVPAFEWLIAALRAHS